MRLFIFFGAKKTNQKKTGPGSLHASPKVRGERPSMGAGVREFGLVALGGNIGVRRFDLVALAGNIGVRGAALLPWLAT